MTKAEYDRKYYLENKDRLLEYQKQYYIQNKEEIKTKEKAYRLKNRDKVLSQGNKNRRKYLYGLSHENYLAKINAQHNLCACCGEPFIKTPHIDHCHTTGKVRGLLCQPCNVGLGYYEKKSSLFKSYLEKYKGE